MSVERFKQIKLGMLAILLVLLGASFYLEESFLAFLGIGTYMAATTLLKTRVKGLLADERQRRVGEEAAMVSFQILMPMLLLASLAMFSGGGEEEFYYLKGLGVVMGYVTCVGLVIYLVTYWYFDRKSGGGEK